MTAPSAVAVLGVGRVDPQSPVLRADDLGAVRGDGVFETVLVRGGQPWLLEEHLARFAGSAARLQLALPALADWRRLAADLLVGWPADREGVLRLICTRGPESGGPPTGYGYLAPVPTETLRQRAEGVRVVTATLGLAADVRAGAPWLLGGVKAVSYAANMAALRHAQAQGADDVIYVSADGLVLEAPTATVVWAAGGRLVTVPADTGVLAGTTAAELFRRAPGLGLATEVRRAAADVLHSADAVWLLSAVRGAVPVTAVDGRARGDAGLTVRIRAALDATDGSGAT